MKKLFTILFFIILITSCEQKVHYYCWECESTIHGNTVEDVVCYEMITDIEDYKARIYELYEGGCTNIECVMIKDSVSQK